MPGISSHDLNIKIREDLEAIKAKLRIYEDPTLYKSILFVTEFLPDEELYGIHQACDCFVMPSHGEALCRPAVDALGFGNTPIVTDNTGMIDFINSNTGWVVPSHQVPVSAMQPPLPWIYTGRETWSEISIIDLQKCMRQAFELDAQGRKLKQELGKRIAKRDFSYETIGKNIEKALDDYTSK